MDLLPMGVLLLFILYNMHVKSCSAQKKCTEGNLPHPRGVCGKYIPELLSLLCDGSYKERSDVVKRSPAAAHSILDMDPRTLLDLAKESKVSDEESTLGGDAFYQKRDATMFLQKKENYYFTGISCECCYNKCKLREMVDYCKNPKLALKNLMAMGMMV